MQPIRRTARTGALIAVALAGSTLAGTSWASSQQAPASKERCVSMLEAKPTVEPGVERKPRCPLAVRYVPRVDTERAAVERDTIEREVLAPRLVGRRA